MECPSLDPRLELLVAREVEAGNKVAARGEAYDGRMSVRLERPFHEEYRATLGEPGILYRRDVKSDGPAPYRYDEEYLETASCFVKAPSPDRDGRKERVARSKGIQLDSKNWLRSGPPDRHERLGAIADAIERELRRLGVWMTSPPARVPEFKAAFGADVLPFVHWIQLVMVPRVREIAATRAAIPGRGVAAYAVREFDGQDEYRGLEQLLYALDEICTPQARPQIRLMGWRQIGAALLLFAIAIPLALFGIQFSTRMNDEIDHRFPPRFILSAQLEGLESNAIRWVELFVEGVEKSEGAIATESCTLVTVRSSTLRIGVRPLALSAGEPIDPHRIAAWLGEWGAPIDAASTTSDANKIRETAESFFASKTKSELMAKREVSGTRVEPATECTVFPGRASETVHNLVLLATLIILLVPLPFAALWVRRRL